MDTKDVDIRVRARMEGRKVFTETAKDIEDLEKALTKQRAAADKGEAGIADLEAGYKKLESALRGVAAALDLSSRFDKQNAALGRTTARLDAARKKQQEFDASLVKGEAMTERQIRQQDRLAAAVDRAAAAHVSAQARVDSTTAKLRAYGIDTAKIGDAQNRMAATIVNGNIALKQQEDAITRTSAAQKKFAGNDVHAALERIRSTVLGMAAAYIGVQQAVGLAGDSINAFSSREGVRNQLALSVGNNKGAIDAEYEYVKQQSDRIGLEFERGAKGYAKFAAAAKLAGRDRDEIRYIWESFAEVGRVANLSADDLDGVFKALEQITSKGKIQAEELRGQLGDRLFGAFQIAAKALKDQFPDLDKAMENGLVTSEQLVAIAEQYRKTVADQLPAAIRSTAAEQARYKNAVREFKLVIADAGFADAFTAALKEITTALKSDDGKHFAESLAAGFSAAADAAVWLLKYSDEVLTVLKALAGLWAINAAGKAVQGVVDYGSALKSLIADGKLTVKELGLMKGAFALLQAALVGWSIGTWANEEFEVVRKAGIALVTGMDEVWTRVKYGAQILWEEIPRYAKNAFAAVLNVMTWGTRQMLEVMQAGFKAIGRDDLAANVGKMLDKLTAKYEQQTDRVAEIRAQMERDLQGIRDVGMQMWTDAERRPSATPSAAPTAGTPTSRPETKPRKSPAVESEKDLAKRQRLVDEITRALEQLDAKVDRSQTDTLRGQLDAIDAQYAALSRKIAGVGGETGKEFMGRLDESLNQLRAQTLAKFNAGLADEHAALLAKLDAVDAAAGRKSKTDLDARLTAIRTSYEATYREIEGFRAKLEANGRSTGDADAARARLDAGIAELQQLETQKFYRDELKRLEGEVNDLLSTRSDRLRTIADQEAASLITSAEARTQTEEAITALQPQITSLVDMARAFAESLRGAFDPIALDTFIAKLESAKASGAGLTRNFQLTGKQIEEMIANRSVQAFGAMTDAIGGAIAGQQSWSDAIKGTGIAFLQFAADFMREIAMMILKQMILNALQNSSIGGAIGGAANAAVKHSGGVVGHTSNRNRTVSPFTFVGAPRYHTGGIAGLAPDEYATILKKNEEVLTADSPRNILNGGAGTGGKGDGGRPQDVSITNYVDAQSFLSAAAATPAGRKIIMNVLSAERAQLRTLVGR